MTTNVLEASALITVPNQNINICNEIVEDNSKSPGFGKRHIQAINLFFLLFTAYFTRSSLSVGVIAMTDINATSHNNIPTFNWTNKNIILSSFFMGYVPSQMFTSWLIPRMNIKILAVSSMSICSIAGFLIPIIASSLGDKGVLAARIIQGISQGFLFPMIQHLLAFWSPPNERGFLGGFIFAGRPVAIVLGMLFPGYIAASSFGWPWIFYSSNALTLVWCLSFAIFSYEKPSKHPSISFKEQKYIEESIGGPESKHAIPTPYKEIFSSLPVWGLFITFFGTVWGFWTLQTQMPMYLKYAMKFNIESSGLLSSVPYMMQFVVSCVSGFISDYLLDKGVWSIGTARKTLTSIGCFVPALSLILIPICGPEESTLAVCLLTLAVSSYGAAFGGYCINFVDISPNHSSILVGFCNGFSQICGFLAPLFVQAIVKDEEDSREWKVVFYTSAGMYIVGGLAFAVFGSAQVQYWDNLQEQDKARNTKNLEEQAGTELLSNKKD